MNYINLLITLIIFPFLIFPQGKSDIKLGDSYQTVISKLKNDFSADYDNVTKTDNKIIVSTKPGYGLPENAIFEYYFVDDHMVKFKMIQHPPDTKKLLAFYYQNIVPKYGEPLVISYDGNDAYNWPKKDRQLGFKAYNYIGFSDWFQDDVVFTTTEIFNKPTQEKPVTPDHIITDTHELILSKSQLDQYYAIYKDPFVCYLRTAFEGYLHNYAISEREKELLSKSNKEYLKSKFIVFSIMPSISGGKEIQIIFQDRPDVIFWAWVYKNADGKFELRAFNIKTDDKQTMSEIKIKYNKFLKDKIHAL